MKRKMTKLSSNRLLGDNPGSIPRFDEIEAPILTSSKQQQICARCNVPILDEYITSVLNKWWHEKCLRCADCERQLTETCYARNGNTYCREDFYRRFAPRCSGCGEVFHPTDLVRKARELYFHVICFMCGVCGRQLHTGDQLFILGENTFVCKEDYLAGNHSGSNSAILNDFGDDDLDDDYDDDDQPGDGVEHMRVGGSPCQPGSSHLIPYDPMSMSSTSGASPSARSHKNSNNNDSQNDSEDGGYDDGDKKSKDDNGNKRRGPRTTIKAKQLEVLKTAFSQTPKPTRHIREQLAKDTGLPMRVIQVWFQNKRSKERRLKQMCSRSKFFMGPHGALKMRKFGMDDGRFYFFDGRPDFGYPGYPPDFFPPHGMPFHPAGPQSLMEQPLPMNMLPLPHGPPMRHDGGPVDPDDDPYGPQDGLVHPGPHSKDEFLQQQQQRLPPDSSSMGQNDGENLATTMKQEINDLSLNGSDHLNSDSTDAW